MRRRPPQESIERCRPVGLGEVVTFEKQGKARSLRYNVCGAVAEIEARQMIALSEFETCLAGDIGMFPGYCCHTDLCPRDQGIPVLCNMPYPRDEQ